MASSIEWFKEKVAELKSDSERKGILSELKTAIFSLNSSQLKNVAFTLQLDLIFDCLNSSDKKQIREACDVLYPLLSSFDPVTLLDGYEDLITRALAHPSAKLRALVLKELCRSVRHSSQLAQRICREEVLLAVTETVAGGPSKNNEEEQTISIMEEEEEEEEEGAAGRAAVNLLCTLGCTPYGVLLFSRGSALLEIIKEQSLRSDIVKYRYYEILVDIAANSPEGLCAVVDSGLLTPMIKEALGESPPGDDGVDLLVQANALQLLGKLATPEHGARYVDDVGAAETLAGILAQSQDDLLVNSLLLPGLIKFYGGIGHIRPMEILSSYPAFPNSLFEAISSSDLSVVGVAMETVGYIGVTAKGKQALYSLYGSQMTKVMNRLGVLMVILPTPHRVRAINSLSSLMTLKEDEDKELLAITQRWFEALCPTKPGSTQWDSAELIGSICRQPFPELQLAGHQVFACLAVLPWGQRMIASCPGLLEFLTSYDNEVGFVRESKYTISKALLGSNLVANHLSESQMIRLESFVRMGPHGKLIGPTEVAVDGAS